ncbi:GyrI-like domain-containing protein [Bacillus sp. RO3]|nr:GyrI-like domain-containing protein [Bacillus sp. RO3]
MKYTLTECKEDRYFVGLKYPGEVSIQHLGEAGLPFFWTTFSEQFFQSHVSDLVPKEEAIGYMKRILDRDRDLNYEYYAACEVTQFGETGDFDRIIIPKGQYLFFEILFRVKDREIVSVVDFLQKESSLRDRVDLSYCFEYYPETFNHNEEGTFFYLVVPVKED